MLNPANLLVRPIAGQSERRVPKRLTLSSSGSPSVRDCSRVHRRPPRAQFCILAPSDDRRSHGCGPEIPADSSTRVQTPAPALIRGSRWTCRESLAASHCVSVLTVSFGPRRSAPDRPDSTPWTQIRSEHASQSTSRARAPASWASRLGAGP